MKLISLISILYLSLLASIDELNDPTDFYIQLQVAEFDSECVMGNAESCRKLGLDYKIIGNFSKSFEFYEKACQGNDAQGCEGLASIYEEGIGIQKDYSKALIYYKKACEKNLAIGCVEAGDIYKNGKGLQQDINQARFFYEKACQLNKLDTCKKIY
jgi:hypothetical protein